MKAQGFPNYRDDILEDTGGFDDAAPAKGGGGKNGDLYGQAVEIVLKDRKPTASYLQRRLNIGYNRAASLIERMEEDGIVGAAGRTGRREILAGASVGRGPGDKDARKRNLESAFDSIKSGEVLAGGKRQRWYSWENS